MKVIKLRVTNRIKRNGAVYMPGDELALEESVANELIEAGAAEFMEWSGEPAEVESAEADVAKTEAAAEEPGLNDMRRGELNEMAVALGLDPTTYRNKSEVIAAIEEAQEAQVGATPETETEVEAEPAVESAEAGTETEKE